MFNFYHHVLQWTPRIHYGSGLTVSDKLASQVTVSLLVLFGFFTILDHYLTRPDPIQCKCPYDTQNCQREFVNSACWVQNEFYLPQNSVLDKGGVNYEQPEPLEMDRAYFQWVGLLFLVQAVFAYSPRGLWLWLSEKCGFIESTFLDHAKKMQTERDPVEYERELRTMTRRLEIVILTSRLHRLPITHKRISFLNGLRITLRFLFCKFIYAFVMMFQIAVVVDFGGAGFDLLDKIHYAKKVNPSSKLPTMLLCKLKMDTKPDAEYLCALPGNTLHQLLFAFLFYWMVFVFLCNLFSFVAWVLRCTLQSQRIRLIQSTLSRGEDYYAADEKKCLVKFVKEYLRVDGVLIVRLIEYCTDYHTMCRVVNELWSNYKQDVVTPLEPTISEDLDV